MPLQQTLALIKPDAIDHADEILDAIHNAGFHVINKRRVRLTLEQASEFYSEHHEKKFWRSLVSFMSSGPVLALVLAKDDAISAWRELIGPTDSDKAKAQKPNSLRALYGTNGQKNALHGSDSLLSAHREIKFFFPNLIIEEPKEVETARDFLEREVNPTLIRGLTELSKNKPEDPVRWLADWLESNNPNTPQITEPEEST